MLNHTAADQVFQALGDPTRRAIVDQLSRGPASVSALAGPLNVTLAAILQHLQVLEESALVRSEKLGRTRTCRLDPAGMLLAERWISQRRSLWEGRLDRLGLLLEEDDEPEPPRAPQKASKKKR